MQIDHIKKPVIVMTGHNGCGKSYAAKIIKRDYNVAVNLNRYDFITRQLMYLCGIKPSETTYNQIDNDILDYHVMNDPQKKDMLNYIKDSITINKGINTEIVAYILEHVFKCSNVNVEYLNGLTDYYTRFNIMYENRKTPDINFMFKLTTDFFDYLLSQYYDFNGKIDTFKYLDNVLDPYKTIQELNHHRIIYYAYKLNEVLYFKEKYKAPIIWLEMDHVIRTNCLAASEQLDKIELLSNDAYKHEMAEIRLQSTAIINNNYDFDTVIGNKIKYTIDFD